MRNIFIRRKDFFVIFFIIFNPSSGYGPKMLQKVANVVVEHNPVERDVKPKDIERAFDENYYSINGSSDEGGCFIELDVPDMGESYSDDLTIDRIDSNGDYTTEIEDIYYAEE